MQRKSSLTGSVRNRRPKRTIFSKLKDTGGPRKVLVMIASNLASRRMENIPLFCNPLSLDKRAKLAEVAWAKMNGSGEKPYLFIPRKMAEFHQEVWAII